MRTIILASASPRRQEILAMSGLPFVVEASDYQEDMSLSYPPQDLAVILAAGKARAVAIKHSDALVIGADTFITFGGKILGKPHTPQKATEMLQILSGNWHEVMTGYCIINTQTASEVSGVDISRVKFAPLATEEITRYVQTGEPLDRAGGYAIQGGAAKFIERIEGNYLSIVGLPLVKILKELETFGGQA